MEEDSLVRGRQLSRRQVVRVSLYLAVIMILVENSTVLYSIYALGLYRDGRWAPVVFGTLLVTGPVVALMVVFCIRWARGVIIFHRALFSQTEPTLQETQDGLRSIFRFAKNGALLFILLYTLAANSVHFTLYWKYNFSLTEVLELAVFKLMSGLNLGVMFYYAVKIIQAGNLREIAERLLAQGVYELEHFKLSIRYKIFLVIFTVGAYLLAGAILMGLNQVENVQRVRLQEEMEFWASQLTRRLTAWSQERGGEGDAAAASLPELETQVSPRTQLTLLSATGEVLRGDAGRLRAEQIQQFRRAQRPAMLTDYRNRELLLYQPLPGLGLTAVWQGRWGTAAGVVEVRNVILALLLATLFLSLVATYLLVNDINQPLTRVLDFLRTISSGRTVGRLGAYSEDELGEFAIELARTTALLEQKTTRAEELLDRIREMSAAIETNSQQVKAAVNAQAAQIIQQASAMTQAQATSKEISTASEQIAHAVSNVHHAAERNLQACLSGNRQITEALESFTALSRYAEEISRRILSLAETIRQITGVVRIIEEIADQINLLSLNAQLEAVGSGAAGRRFAVVAAEVSRLAVNSMHAVEQIKKLMTATASAAEEVSALAGQGTTLVGQGSAAADAVGKVFTEIADHAGVTEKASLEIIAITGEQQTATDLVAQTIAELHANAQLVKNSANEVLAAMNQLAAVAGRLTSVFQQSEVRSASS